MFKSLLYFETNFITSSDSLRTNFPIKQLIQKNNFNEIIQDEKVFVQPLFLLNFNLCNPFNNVFIDKYKLHKSFANIVELDTILKFLMGGTHSLANNDDSKKALHKFINSTRTALLNFVKFFDNGCYCISFLEFRKILEALLYVRKIIKADNDQEIKNILEVSITNFREEFINNKRENDTRLYNDIIYNTWCDISELLHGVQDNKKTFMFDDFNGWICTILSKISLVLSIIVKEFKTLLYIFDESYLISNFLRLLSKYESENTKDDNKNMNFMFVANTDFTKYDNKFIDDIFVNIKSYSCLWGGKINLNDCKYYESNKTKIDYLFNCIDFEKTNRFNRYIGKTSKLKTKKFKALFNIKDEYKNDEIYLFYLEKLSYDYYLFDIHLDSKFIDLTKKILHGAIFLHKIAFDRCLKDIIILCYLITEFIFYYSLIDGYENGIFTLIIEYIQKSKLKPIIAGEFKNLNHLLKYNRKTRHLKQNSEGGSDKRREQASIISSICEKAITFITKEEVSTIINQNSDIRDDFNHRWSNFLNKEKERINEVSRKFEDISEDEIINEKERKREDFLKLLIEY